MTTGSGQREPRVVSPDVVVQPAVAVGAPPPADPWAIFYADDSSGVVAMNIFYEARQAGMDTTVFSMSASGRAIGLDHFKVLVLAMPTITQDTSIVLSMVEGQAQLVDRYRRMRRASGKPIGRVVVVGSQAMIMLPAVRRQLRGVDGWFNLEDIHLIARGDGHPTPQATPVSSQGARESHPVDEGSPTLRSDSTQLQQELVEAAWCTARAHGLTTVDECSQFLAIVEEFRTNYFESPRQASLYRPLGNHVAMNALDVILKGAQDQIFAKTHTRTMEDLARGLRTLSGAIEQIMPSFNLPKVRGVQQVFRRLHQAAVVIVDTQSQ